MRLDLYKHTNTHCVPAVLGEQGRLIVDLDAGPTPLKVSLALHKFSQRLQGPEAQVPAVTHPVMGP
jgi:hypothetical protein